MLKWLLKKISSLYWKIKNRKLPNFTWDVSNWDECKWR